MPLSLLQVTEQPRATRSWTRVHRRQERFPDLKHEMPERIQSCCDGRCGKSYDAAAYGRDARPFAPTLTAAAPEIIFLGPSSGGDASNGQSVANGKFDRYSVSRLSFGLLQK
jgi:hypothetical protein